GRYDVLQHRPIARLRRARPVGRLRCIGAAADLRPRAERNRRDLSGSRWLQRRRQVNLWGCAAALLTLEPLGTDATRIWTGVARLGSWRCARGTWLLAAADQRQRLRSV